MEQQRKEARLEAAARDDEMEETRANASKKLKSECIHSFIHSYHYMCVRTVFRMCACMCVNTNINYSCAFDFFSCACESLHILVMPRFCRKLYVVVLFTKPKIKLTVLIQTNIFQIKKKNF